ncbi:MULTISPECIES: hypothetical protein [Pseudomonas]|uniref:hypothetical protein n=1 Tax=Pseudomonas TaxID=286 RepID=UPI000B8238EA|nr:MULTISPECIES: hypothetical protein [Pseudomonas]NRH29275.1 hypothetical protein [Pseudomonas sp. MS19]
MNFWIILILLFCVLSPFAMLMPSRRLRGRMDVRTEARRMGLIMQLSRQEWPYWLENKPLDSCPQYHRSRLRGRREHWCFWQDGAGNWLNQWREPCADPALAAALAELPADVYKAEANAQMVGICWGEAGKPGDLEKIATFLKAHA